MMEKTKVAVIHTLAAPYRTPLFERLLRDNELDVRLFFTDKPTSIRSDWELTIDDASGRIIRLPEIGLPPMMRGGDKVRLNTSLSKIFGWKPDVVLIYGYNEPTNLLVAFWCIAKKIPYILFAETANVRNFSTRRRIFLPIIDFVIRRASHLAPASESCAAFFRESGAKSGMTRVPCVPDVERLMSIAAVLKDRRNSIRTKLGINNRFVVLFAGRFLSVKGLVNLFEAIDIVNVKDSNVVLAIVGFGPKEEFMKSQCNERPDSCRFFGYVDENTLYELFSVADIHLMPSWYEGYGVVCAEALSFGVPSIVTETSGCRDLVVHGSNGFVVEPKNPKRIAECILEVSKNPKLHMQMRSNAAASMQSLAMDNIYSRVKIAIRTTLSSES